MHNRLKNYALVICLFAFLFVIIGASVFVSIWATNGLEFDIDHEKRTIAADVGSLQSYTQGLVSKSTKAQPTRRISRSPQTDQQFSPASTRTTNEEFADHYAPDVGDTVTMTTMVRRNPGQILMFALDFPERDPNAGHFLDYRCGYACDEPITDAVPKKARRR